MDEYRGDLHVHSCLSPCGDLSMLPRSIARMAKKRKLDMIGICDHNSTENVMAVRKAGEQEGVAVIGGIEITSQEEVHVMGFFDSEESLKQIQRIVYEHLPGKNDENVFGEQLVVDENDEILGLNEKLLIGATTLSLEDVVNIIHELGGIAIASHVDRESFSIIGQLGFIPEGLPLDGLEVSPQNAVQEIREKFPQVNKYPVITFSDAHQPEEIGKRMTTFYIEEPNVDEFGKALRNIEGRGIRV